MDESKKERNISLLNKLTEMKTTLSFITPMNGKTILEKINSIKLSNPDLPLELLSFLDSLKETIEFKIRQQEGNIRGSLIIKDLEAEKIIEHEHMLEETKILQNEYDDFRQDFVNLLKSDNELLRKIKNGENLTDDEKHSLVKDDKVQEERWKIHYKLKANYKKLIDYSKAKITNHENDLSENNYHPEKENEIKQLIVKEKVILEDHEQNLEKLKLAEVERDEQTQLIQQCLEISNDKKFNEMLVEKNNEYHGSEYAINFAQQIPSNSSAKNLKSLESHSVEVDSKNKDNNIDHLHKETTTKNSINIHSTEVKIESNDQNLDFYSTSTDIKKLSIQIGEDAKEKIQVRKRVVAKVSRDRVSSSKLEL